MNVRILEQSLKHLGYDVMGADGGQAALDAIAREQVDLVLLDIVMPDLSGKDVLRQLRANPGTADLPVILVSGLDETEDIVEGLDLGASDYITKPINLPVLQARLGTQTALKRARDELKQTADLLAAEIDDNARELQVAGQVQRSILPKSPSASARLDTAWWYEPASAVSGDLFDIIPLTGDRTLLFMADAMGHGVQAALVVSAVKATLAGHVNEADDLSILMGLLDLVIGDLFDDRYVTAAACVVDPREHRLRYAVAGHPPILLAGPEGVDELHHGSLPLGTHLAVSFASGNVPFAPGSALLMYTDGVLEAASPDGQPFGIERLREQFAATSGQAPAAIVKSIREAIDQHRAHVPLPDDLTILAARLP
jgi:serine phosphatase RsbU (regulator of sigma subunit)